MAPHAKLLLHLHRAPPLLLLAAAAALMLAVALPHPGVRSVHFIAPVAPPETRADVHPSESPASELGQSDADGEEPRGEDPQDEEPAAFDVLPLPQQVLDALAAPAGEAETAPTVAEPGDPRLTQARQLRLAGAYEEAAAAYRNLLNSGPSQVDSIALGAAESELAAGDYVAAVGMVERALRENPERREALIVKAEALLALGLRDDAVDVLTEASESALVGGYAAFRAAELEANADRPRAARELYARAVDLGLNRWYEVAARRRIGRSYIADGESDLATTWLTQAVETARELERYNAPVWFDGELVRRNSDARRAGVLLDLARAYGQAGATNSVVDTYATVVADYPTSTEARDALGALAEMGATARVSGYQRGVVLVNAGRSREALAALNAALDAAPAGSDAPAAHYYRGLALRAVDDVPAAIDELTAMARDYPTHRLAPEALAQAARLADSRGTQAEALAAHFAVADSFPTSEQAARSLLRIGSIYLGQGDGSAARAAWARLGRLHPDAIARAQGLFWQGRSLLAIGQTAAGRDALVEAAALAPFTFAGIRARDLAEGGAGAEAFARLWSTAAVTAPVDDVAVCADWIVSWAGPPSLAPPREGGGDTAREASGSGSAAAAMARIDMLVSVGMHGAALAAGLEAAALAAQQPHELHRLAVALNERGLYPASMHTALRLGAASPERSADQGPPCLQRLAYPLVFPNLVETQAQQYGLDPLYLLALLRQESWFNSHALSSAQARGMSQVISSTRQSIGRALGRTDVTDDDLYRPREAIAFGAYYLADVYRSLGQRPLMALAGYNAGPGNARRWMGGNPGIDADDYAEAIDFTETRGYVRSIYQMYARYRGLYG